MAYNLYGVRQQEEAVEAFKAAVYDNLPRWLLETAGAEKWQLPDPSIYGNQADLYRRLSWVFAAVGHVAQAGALAAFSVAQAVKGKEPKDIPLHDFELLLMHPNDIDSRYEFLYATIALFKLTGNAYWWINQPSPDAPPDELWIIPPHKIRIEPDDRLFIKAYWYDPGNGQEIPLDPSEIVHFKTFNPFSRFVGLSAIESLALVAQGDMGMQDWNTRLFKENNARLPGILAFKEMREKSVWDQIKADTREAAKKREMLMLQGVGDGVNWLQNAVSQKEMEFLEGRKANREEIFTVLAPGLLSMLSENATEANGRTGKAVFNELSVYPNHVMMAEKITNSILPFYQKNSPSPQRSLLGHFEDVRVADKEMKLREEEQFSKTHTIAEIREEFYGDSKLGDERDDLLPSQIKAESGNIQPPPPPLTTPQNQPMQEMNAEENKPPEEKPQEEPKPAEPNKAALDDLAKWQRKAAKKIGEKVDFASENIPSDVAANIAEALPTCKTEAAIKAVFDQARQNLKPKGNEAAIVLQGLMEALKAL